MKMIYLGALAGNLALMMSGQFVGWASPSISKMLRNNSEDHPHLNNEEASWIVSLLIIGSFLGTVIISLIVNVIGRKSSMLLIAAPAIISWLIIAFATSAWELYIARFICGVGYGMGFTVTPMYVSEISPANIRGFLASMVSVFYKFGILLEFTIGSVLSKRDLALVSLAVPLLFLLTFIWVPESPYHLMRRGDKQKAVESLVRLRGKVNVDKEANNIEQAIKIDLANKNSFSEIFLVPGNRRALLITIMLNVIHPLSGSQAVQHYSEIIFNQANINLEGKYLTIVLGVVQLVVGIVGMILIDYSGRKLLLTISCFGMACSNAVVGAYFYLRHIGANIEAIEWLPATGIIAFIVTYSLGLSLLIVTIVSELFPTNVKASCLSISLLTNCFFSFIVMKWYLIVVQNIGEHVCFWIFTAFDLFGMFFTLLYIPETKGKTLEQIQEELNGGPRT